MSTTVEYEQQMEQVRLLNSLRNKMRDLEKAGYEGLKKQILQGEKSDKWIGEGDLVESAMLLHAMFGDSKEVDDKLTQDLETLMALSPGSFFVYLDPDKNGLGGREDHVPVVRAAIILEALSKSFLTVLSGGGFSSYARIVYELHKASEPDEMMGGAGAGSAGAVQTAFVTLWCIRSILSFADACREFGQLAEALNALEQGRAPEVPEEWRSIEAAWWTVHVAPLKEAARITAKRLVRHSRIAREKDDLTKMPNEACARIRELASEALLKAREVHGYYCKSDEEFSPLARDKVGNAIQKLITDLESIAAAEQITELGEMLKAMADHVETAVRPTSRYMQSVLDQELASTLSQSQRIADGAELLFAGDGLALLGRSDDPRIEKALRVVAQQVTDAGRIPSHRPFDIFTKGYVLHVAAAESIWAFAELAAHVPDVIEAGLVQKILRHFQDTWQKEDQGWRHERAQGKGPCMRWLSAISLRALNALRQALDKQINRLILTNLSVRSPEELSLSLPNLFYPDFGLVASGIRDESIAMALQYMRAHILGFASKKNKYSLVLYGPPGTGKTTIAEALAKSCQVPLVEVTPSDILLAGAEKIETRARLVFEGLSMLTDAVVLLDEFDSILWSRESSQKPDGVFRFLTPGMLPKLKKLNECAEKQRVAFILSTNLIGGLDKAATREGRFDMRFGIYPPDFLSRAGRLIGAWTKWSVGEQGAIPFPEERLGKVLEESAGGPMTRLAKPGWFTAPKKGASQHKTPFNYLLGESDKVEWPMPEKSVPPQPVQDYPGETLDKLNQEVLREWKEWYFVKSFDEGFNKGGVEWATAFLTEVSKDKNKFEGTWENWKNYCDEMVKAHPPGVK